MNMHVLIIGGSSGLGLVLARRWQAEGAKVVITGRTDPKVAGLTFCKLDLGGNGLAERIETFVAGQPKVDVLVYAAGFYQEGRITDLSVNEIENMLDVCGRGLIYSIRALLAKQGELAELITITSSSQWVARQLEPVYNFVKAGAGHFASSMAEDGRIAKVMHLAPSGMQTAFWRDKPGKDVGDYLDPEAVADELLDQRQKEYKYLYVRVERNPVRVQEVEKR